MKKTSLAIGAIAFTALVVTGPAQARGGFGPGFAGGFIAGSAIAGGSAYAFGPGYGGYGYPGYGYGGSRYYGLPGSHHYPYLGDNSTHGGQPYYGQ